MGGLLVGLSTFQAEFDFGVPQFQMVFQPILIAVAAGVALVCARLWIGPGGALAATLFFLLTRGMVGLIVAGVFGESLPHLPLYLAEAACVELTGLALARRPLAFAAASGVAIGTVGFAAEYGWSQVAMPLPWTTSLLPEAPLLALIAGLAGAIAGALLALSLNGNLPGRALTKGLALGSLLLVIAVVADGLITTQPQGLRASVRLTDVAPGPGREVAAKARIRPASAAADARWLTITSWQGGGLVVDRLRSLGGGVYRSTEPIPVNGEWKTTLRLQTGRTIAGLPIYLPADRAIPAAAVPAPGSLQRAFVSDKQILQRETKRGLPGWLTTVAPLVVLAIALALLAILAIGLRRLGREREGVRNRRSLGDWGDAPIPATAGAGLTEHHRVVVIGAGFSGIGLGIRMRREGIDDFVVLEKAPEVGGTWEANTYPGIQCDIPSHLYSLSFMPNPGWTRTFSEGAEIWDYLRRCAQAGGLTPHLRLGCEVLGAEWEEGEKRWRIETSNGSLTRHGPGRRERPALGARDPRYPRPRHLRGSALSLRALGP